MKKYPLTAAQNMHYRWIKDYGTQQVAGLSVVCAIQYELDFDVLKQCIAKEYERYGCMRVRFTPADKNGEIKQYLIEKEEREIPFGDLSTMSFEEAEKLMQSWAYETFDGDDIPLCDVTMLRLPDGYNGFFVHMDHRLIDSIGVLVMANDIMALYTHYKLGCEYPEELPTYEHAIEDDIKKVSDQGHFARDKRFWDGLLDKWGEPLYSDVQGPSALMAARKRHRKSTLKSADIRRKDLFVEVKDYKLDADSAGFLLDFCKEYNLSMNNLLLLGLRTYLSKQNEGQEDITVENFIARRTTSLEKYSGGSRTIMFPCRTVIGGDRRFLDAAFDVQNMQTRVYIHSNYDPELIRKEIVKRYKTPKNTGYVSCYLTYMPALAKVDNPLLEKIPVYSKWFANGAATKKMYLTVSHTEDGGMNFSYHYQTAELNEKDIELLNYYLMRILFRGAENPDKSVSEIIGMV